MSTSIAVLLGLALATAAPPTGSELLGRAAQAKKPAQAGLYLDIAAQQRLAGADRLRAARQAARHGKNDNRLKARLWEARIAGVLGKARDRRRALASARTEAKRLGRGADVAALELVSAREAALLALVSRLEEARRAAAPPGGPLNEALRRDVDGIADDDFAAAARRIDDVRLEQLLRYAAALSKDDAAARASALQQLARGKGARDAAAVTARALWHLAAEVARDGVTVDAARHAIAADRLVWPPQSEAVGEPAPYSHARSAQTHALCVALLATGGRCHDVEQKDHGALSFYDFSAEKTAKDAAFDPVRAEEALAAYDVLLQRCMQQGARDKAKLTQQTVVELEWALGQNGRVPSYDLRPTRLRGTVVDTCLKEAFSLFRHPRYQGELQHMRLSFDVRGPDL